MQIIALNLHRIDKGAVLGSVSLWFPAWNLRVHEVLWGRRGEGGAEWVLLPRRQWTTESGETRYARIIQWDDDKAERDFRASALEAIHQLAEREADRG